MASTISTYKITHHIHDNQCTYAQLYVWHKEEVSESNNEWGVKCEIEYKKGRKKIEWNDWSVTPNEAPFVMDVVMILSFFLNALWCFSIAFFCNDFAQMHTFTHAWLERGSQMSSVCFFCVFPSLLS